MTLRLADHCGLALCEIADGDPRVWVLDGDLADSDGAYHFARRHPDRFVMGGIAEQALASMAAGMASCGLRPWLFSFAAFLSHRAYDQVRVSIAQTRMPVVLVGSHSGGLPSRNGKTHAATNDIAAMASLPGVQVWAPASPEDVRFACDALVAQASPAYVRLPRRPAESIEGRPALLRWIGRPTPIAMVATGLGTCQAIAARRELASRGCDVGVLHCLRVAPLPLRIADELRRVERLFVVEDHSTFGGLASLLAHAGVCAPSTHMHRMGWPRVWPSRSGSDDDLLEAHGLTPRHITARVLESASETVTYKELI